jgi:hypothetical protein
MSESDETRINNDPIAQEDEDTPESPRGVTNPNFQSPTDENKDVSGAQPIDGAPESARYERTDDDGDYEKD